MMAQRHEDNVSYTVELREQLKKNHETLTSIRSASYKYKSKPGSNIPTHQNEPAANHNEIKANRLDMAVNFGEALAKVTPE